MAQPPFSFKGINPLSAPESRRTYRRKQLAEIKKKIDKISDRMPRDAIALHEEYNDLVTTLNDDDQLRKPSQQGATITPTSVPKWLRDKIDALALTVEQSFEQI